nr:N-6 DNA methylase [Allomuricauda sp.]
MLFKKTQKLLDRFLFIFFAEDSGLLPPNSVRKIIDKWKDDTDWGDDRKLYDIFKQYFGFINSGRPAKGERAEIFGYNGGLFIEDSILDNIKIDDDILLKYSEKLSTYDFQSEVDVNILGHIFENSLNEIENITAELEGQQIDKSKTKRKKDGVFYTPKYITKYIVDNTIGKLCEEKKAELSISDERFGQAGKRSKKGITDLKLYRDWLLDLKICDPACGSGAFLNQALEFLIGEHRYLDELTAQYHKSPLVLSDIETHILEQNIYGVDINEESVEIAKLSLWLRTAQRGRKLTSLNNNIKCGNSLIDDPKAEGEKAFNWKKEFAKVFANGGFDVVLGNPPYVRAELLGGFREYFELKYKVFHPASDLFAYFYELGSNLIKKEGGLMGYISNTFDKTTAGKVLREYLTKETTFHNYIDFTEVQVFEGATTYPVIIILEKGIPVKSKFKYAKIPKAKQSKVIEVESIPFIDVLQSTLSPDAWSFLPKENVDLFSKLAEIPTIREKFGKCYYGVKTALNDAFIVEKNWAISEHVKHIYEGKEIKKWHTPAPQQKLILFESKWTKANYGENRTEEEFIASLNIDFPEIIRHLLLFEERAKKRYDKGDFWWELRNCGYYELFDKPKIIFPNLQNTNKFCLDSTGVFVNAPAVFLPVDSKTLLCILNSKVVWEFLKSICVVRSGGYIEVKPQYFEQIPLPDFKNEVEFERKADEIINLTDHLQKTETTFIKLLQTKFNVEKLSKRLQNWHDIEFKDFLKELKKAKVQLSLSEEAEWMHYFNEQKQKAIELKSEIIRIDNEIDQMVYQLYGLTDEEIAIIENS